MEHNSQDRVTVREQARAARERTRELRYDLNQLRALMNETQATRERARELRNRAVWQDTMRRALLATEEIGAYFELFEEEEALPLLEEVRRGIVRIWRRF